MTSDDIISNKYCITFKENQETLSLKPICSAILQISTPPPSPNYEALKHVGVLILKMFSFDHGWLKMFLWKPTVNRKQPYGDAYELWINDKNRIRRGRTITGISLQFWPKTVLKIWKGASRHILNLPWKPRWRFQFILEEGENYIKFMLRWFFLSDIRAWESLHVMRTFRLMAWIASVLSKSAFNKSSKCSQVFIVVNASFSVLVVEVLHIGAPLTRWQNSCSKEIFFQHQEEFKFLIRVLTKRTPIVYCDHTLKYRKMTTGFLFILQTNGPNFILQLNLHVF